MTNYERITSLITTELEKGTVPWDKPWSTFGSPRNVITGKSYRGINHFLLTMHHDADPRYVTFKQAKSLGGHVKKGEQGRKISFFRMLESKTQTKHDGSLDSFPYLKIYTVFNVSQCEDLNIPSLDTKPRTVTPIAVCEQIIENYPNPPTIDWSGDSASYRVRTDQVSMPPKAQFTSDELSYSVLFHELIHSTGHSSRLNRSTLTETKHYGSSNYSKEELIAELGSAFLSGSAGLTPDIPRTASYLASWIKALKGDSRLLVSAASQAQKASDHVLAVQPA
jgi:antirestriction protein ArdC